jgi:hypothetical protein
LPIRRPPAGSLQHIRHNGRFKLEIFGHPEYGLPFGQDRLIPVWVSTLAVRQKSRTILFRSAAEIPDEFDLPKDTPHYRRLVAGFQRIFTSTVFFGIDSGTAARGLGQPPIPILRPPTDLVHSGRKTRPCRIAGWLQHD